MDLYLPEPSFNSSLTSLIFELEHLRDRDVRGSTPAWLFFDLKDVVHKIESLTSVRIEGNHTTIMAAVEDEISGGQLTSDENIMEFRNIQKAIQFIEKTVMDVPLSRDYICELHRLVVDGLSVDKEGSREPGRYRRRDVRISKSNHRPPSYLVVPEQMEALVTFINQPNEPQHDLLKAAVVHHRLAALHPFDNGNGRTIRLVTYAMLTKQRFIDDRGFRLLNPSAIFCMDRQRYYDNLAVADTGSREGLLQWCEYVLLGIRTEIGKIDRLLDDEFAKREIVRPALELALQKKWLTGLEYEILLIAMRRDVIQAADIKQLFTPGASRNVQVTRVINAMKRQGYLMSLPKSPRKYVLRFSNNYLLRGVMQQMDAHNLLPLHADE